MARESTQHKLDRVRRPRVHLTYDVEIGGAIQLKELPFVLGVLADLSGKPDEPLPRLKDRKFVEIDRDNFNKVLAGHEAPARVPGRQHAPATTDTKIDVELRFNAHRRLRARAGRPAGRAPPQAAGGARTAARTC